MGLVHRFRIWLMWRVAPFATKQMLDGKLRLIQMRAESTEESTIQPSQLNEEAKGTLRNTQYLADYFDLERTNGSDNE